MTGRHWKPWLSVLGYVLVLLIPGTFIFLPSTQLLENQWRDHAFRLLLQTFPRDAPSNIAIVGIDDEDLASFGVPVALLHRELGGFLEAMALARPRVVGLDVLLPSTSFDKMQPGLDAALARGIVAMRGVAPLILGISSDGRGNPRPLQPLFRSLVGAQAMGYVFVVEDADGVVRRFSERIGSLGEHIPTLSGQMARALQLKPQAGLINYAVGPAFTYTPLRQVLQWGRTHQLNELTATFGGKAVLLGSALSFDDQQRTPVQVSSWTADSDSSHGVLVHAQQLRTIATGTMIQTMALPYALLTLTLLASSWWLRPGAKAWTFTCLFALAIQASAVLALHEGWALPSLAMCLALLAGLTAKSAVTGLQIVRERRRLRETFGGFVSPGILKEILAGRLDPKSEGSREDICVLFSDIRGFTTLSETMQPEKVTLLLNRYFDCMVRAIHHHGGTLDKFIGDGIMAVFGTPVRSRNPCQDALNCANHMIDELRAFNAEQIRQGVPALEIGVGLHYGPAIVGYVGSRDRYEYSAIGDTVNTASRIEGLTKDSGYPIFLSRSVYERVDDQEGLVFIGPLSIKGRSAIEVYGLKPELTPPAP